MPTHIEGLTMGHKNELVCGVGVNDAGYAVCNTVRVGGRSKNLWICPFYRAWTGMLERSYSAKFQARHPTYIGCTVDTAWHLFSTFKEWMSRQDHEGKHLDKDILVAGNKIYSAETCAFVSKAINTFIVDSRAIRGDWPIGVSWHKGRQRFVAQCRDPFTGQHKFLGYFVSSDLAHEAWRAHKHQIALVYADQQNDQRVAASLRARYANPSFAKAA